MEMEPDGSGDGAVSAARQGAAQGLEVWLAYAVVEYFVIIILQAVRDPNYVFPSWYWYLTLLLFGIYALTGAVVGTLLGAGVRVVSRGVPWLRGADPRTMRRMAALLSLLVAFSVNIVCQIPRSGRTVFTLLACMILVPAAFKSVHSALWARRLRFMTNPWTASLLLLGPLWMIYVVKPPERLVALFIATISAVVILFASFLLQLARQRILGEKSSRRERGSLLAAISRGALAALAIMGVSALMDQRLFPASLGASRASTQSGAPNIIWIVLDTARADHMSVYGYARDTTPNLKTFVAGATLYKNAISASSFTVSSHASMFTGVYPSRHGAHYTPGVPFSSGLGDYGSTIAEILRARGYRTAAVVANFGALGTWSRLDRGFEYYEPWTIMPVLGAVDFSLRRVLRPAFATFASNRLEYLARPAGDINDSVFRVLDDVRALRAPFFLFINYMEAHTPYFAPAPFNTLYPGRDPSFDWDEYFGEVMKEVMAFKRGLRRAERQHLISQYDGAITYFDSQLGVLFDRLKQLGLYEDSLLIVTSDHGEAFGERSLLSHSVSLYQDQVHVPLIIKYPGANEQAVVEEFVSGVDIMPTILDLLGHDIPEVVQGRSLLKLERLPGMEVKAECYPLAKARRIHERFHGIRRAIFQDRWKLMVFPKGRRELYNISQDPDEQLDLHGAENDLGRQLQRRLDQWSKDLPAQPAKTTKPDQKTLEQLRSLGYIR